MDIRVLASGSTGNCYRVSDGSTALLLDAGIPVGAIRRGCGFQLSAVTACLVTHSHGDHSKAVAGLLRAGVDCYLPAAELAACGLPAHHRLHPLERDGADYRAFPVGTFTVLPFHVEHDTPEPVGYLLASGVTGEKLLYFTDTYFLRQRFSGLTHIIGEVNYDRETLWERVDGGSTPAVRAKRLFTSHMSLETFLDFLDANDLTRLRQLYICHMSDDHGGAERILRAVRQKTGAEVYLCERRRICD
ncbi:MAG: MBL fold metallo-hydrolase [Clostridiales bacterium]|nr:MBL fold metallo-hydrolase [Clostridiales bacterium]